MCHPTTTIRIAIIIVADNALLVVGDSERVVKVDSSQGEHRSEHWKLFDAEARDGVDVVKASHHNDERLFVVGPRLVSVESTV